MEKDIIPTLEECIEVYEKKGKVTIIENGRVVDVRKED